MSHVPLPGSIAVDTGLDAGCPATDQRGQARPFDGNSDGPATCDIGAVESHTPFQVMCSPRPRVVVATANNGDGRLRINLSTTGANNAFRRIQVSQNANGIVTPVPPFVGTSQSELLVARQTPGVARTVSLSIIDACGIWQTFVGGGPGAF